MNDFEPTNAREADPGLSKPLRALWHRGIQCSVGAGEYNVHYIGVNWPHHA